MLCNLLLLTITIINIIHITTNFTITVMNMLCLRFMLFSIRKTNMYILINIREALGIKAQKVNNAII